MMFGMGDSKIIDAKLSRTTKLIPEAQCKHQQTNLKKCKLQKFKLSRFTLIVSKQHNNKVNLEVNCRSTLNDNER